MTNKKIEIDIWINKGRQGRFMTEFEAMNDVKFDGEELGKRQGDDIRVALFYRNFGGKLKYPEQSYYQLNAVYEGD
jgi:hypothetical protein